MALRHAVYAAGFFRIGAVGLMNDKGRKHYKARARRLHGFDQNKRSRFMLLGMNVSKAFGFYATLPHERKQFSRSGRREDNIISASLF